MSRSTKGRWATPRSGRTRRSCKRRGLSRVTEFIRRWKAEGGTSVTKAFVPLKFEPGEAHQFDWSEEHLVIGGAWRKLLVAHLKLCYSRAFVVQVSLPDVN